jgi:hypothetical protein
VRIAGREFAEGVADTDDRPTIELIVRNAFALDPAAVGKAVTVLTTEPLLTAKLGRLLSGSSAHSDAPSDKAPITPSLNR